MKVRKLNFLLALFLCLAFRSYSIPPLPEPRAIPPVGDPVPIDSEMSILFAGAILLGTFYLLRKPKSKLSGETK